MIINFGWMDALRRLTLDIVCFIDAKGFGGIIKLSSSPSNIPITFFYGRAIYQIPLNTPKPYDA